MSRPSARSAPSDRLRPEHQQRRARRDGLPPVAHRAQRLPQSREQGKPVGAPLVAQGYVAHHWLEFGPKHSHDAEVFLVAQQRNFTIFTLNRGDFLFAAACWGTWGVGDHHGVIAPREGPQLPPAALLRAMQRFCADQSVFINRIALF